MSDWHYEDLTCGVSMGLHGKALYETNRIKIIDSGLGRALYIDGSLQSCEFDEYIYHEMLVHPTMQLHTNPQKVLIIGGGDGGTLREVLKYQSVETVHMVEINEKVVRASQEHLPHMKLKESLDDPRVTLFIGCGNKFLKSPTVDKYDVILVDIGDPTDECIVFYTSDFIDKANLHLTNHGVITFQSQYYLGAPEFVRNFRTLCAVNFWSANYYHCPIPTYPLGGIGFMRCCKTPNISTSIVLPEGLRYVNRRVFDASHALPPFIDESRLDKFFDKAAVQIFNWKKYVLGIDLGALSSFAGLLDGEGPFEHISFPTKVFTMGMKDGRPYYSLRLCSDIAKDKVARIIKRLLHARGLKLRCLEGFEPCGLEWNSFDNRELSVVYAVNEMEIAQRQMPKAAIYYPDQYYSKGFVVLKPDGCSYECEVFTPSLRVKISEDGVLETYQKVSYELLTKRVFRGALREVDYLLENGLKIHSMSFTNVNDYELALSI